MELPSRKIALAIGGITLSLLATGCFGIGETGSTVTTTTTTKKNETIEGIALTVTPEWSVVAKKDAPSDFPAGFVVGITNPIRSDRFTANVNVFKSDLPQEMPSTDYALEAIQSSKQTLTNFSEKNRESVKGIVGGKEVPTLLVTFEGKQKPDGDTIRFLQTYLVKGKTAYLVTGAFLPDEDQAVQEKIDAMVRSVEVR